MDRLDEWRLFLAVAARQSFAKAARESRRSPQAATRAVAALEARLGTRLFHRTTRTVRLTDDGERLLDRARHAVAELDALEQSSETDELRGVLSVTAPVLFGQRHVLPIVTEMLAAHPAVDVRLLLVDRVVSLAEEGIDVAVRIGELPDSSLRTRLVGHVREHFVAAPSYLARAGKPRSVETLAKHDGIAWLGDDRVKLRVRLTTSSGEAALAAARAGVGIVRMLSYQTATDLAEGSLVRVLPSLDSGPIPVQLVRLPIPRLPSKARSSRSAEAFVDLAYDRLKAVISRGV